METSDDENLLINEIPPSNFEYHESPQCSYPNNQQFDANVNEEIQLVTAPTPSTSRKSLKTGDIRMHAGALTGVGPIRSIMKKSATDVGINQSSDFSETEFNTHNNLPKVQLASFSNEETLNKTYVTPNLRKKHNNVMQSDL